MLYDNHQVTEQATFWDQTTYELGFRHQPMYKYIIVLWFAVSHFCPSFVANRNWLYVPEKGAFKHVCVEHLDGE